MPAIDFRRCRRLALARQSGRDAKAGEPYVAGAVNEHVFGLDVFVDQTALVGVAERRCQVNGKAQKVRQIERLFPIPLQNAVERLTARIGENEDCPSFVTRERQRLGRPRRLKFGCERVFVLEASQTLGQRLFCGRSDDQERHWIAALPGAVKREFRSTRGLAPTRTQKLLPLVGSALQNVNRPAS